MRGERSRVFGAPRLMNQRSSAASSSRIEREFLRFGSADAQHLLLGANGDVLPAAIENAPASSPVARPRDGAMAGSGTAHAEDEPFDTQPSFAPNTAARISGRAP